MEPARREETIDVAAQLNTPSTLAQIDSLLSGSASRTSGIMAEGVFWPNVPYYGNNPSAHNNSDMLIRVYFNFHISTPWYCSDADGNISYYIFLYLDGSGHLQGYVDGWSYSYSGGGPFCTGSINDALNNAVPTGWLPFKRSLTMRLPCFQALRSVCCITCRAAAPQLPAILRKMTIWMLQLPCYHKGGESWKLNFVNEWKPS